MSSYNESLFVETKYASNITYKVQMRKGNLMENMQYFVHVMLDLLRDPACATLLTIISLLATIRSATTTKFQREEDNQNVRPDDRSSDFYILHDCAKRMEQSPQKLRGEESFGEDR
jgi:hypothetical protein